jgi:hypothetical protein
MRSVGSGPDSGMNVLSTLDFSGGMGLLSVGQSDKHDLKNKEKCMDGEHFQQSNSHL